MTGVNHYIPGMPRGSRTLTRALSVALLSAAALSACVPFGTDADAERHSGASASLSPVAPSAAETTAPPLSPSPSPTVTAYPALGPLPDGVAPARPAAMDGPPTLEGAKAIATYFLLLVPYAFQTGDTESARAISSSECVFCQSLATNATAAFGQGQHTEGGALQILRLGGTEVDTARFFDIKAQISELPSRTVTKTGLIVRTYAAAATEVDMVVLHENGRWAVREVSYQAVK